MKTQNVAVREDIIKTLKRIYDSTDDLRLGQILVNAIDSNNEDLHRDLFYIKDDDLLIRLYNFESLLQSSKDNS